MMQIQARAAAGFTLFEVLVALLIGGLVTLTAAATVGSVPELATRADERLTSELRAAAVRGQIRAWLRASYVDRDSTFDASFAGIDGPRPGGDALRFAVQSIDGVDGRAILLLGIDGESGPAPALMVEIRPERGSPRRIVLVPGATELEIQYLYFVSGEGRWFLGWNSAVERPAAVRLWIGGRSLDPLLRLPITVWLRA